MRTQTRGKPALIAPLPRSEHAQHPVVNLLNERLQAMPSHRLVSDKLALMFPRRNWMLDEKHQAYATQDGQQPPLSVALAVVEALRIALRLESAVPIHPLQWRWQADLKRYEFVSFVGATEPGTHAQTKTHTRALVLTLAEFQEIYGPNARQQAKKALVAAPQSESAQQSASFTLSADGHSSSMELASTSAELNGQQTDGIAVS